MYDYIKGLYRFSNNKDLIYDPSRREEILKLNIKKDHDYEWKIHSCKIIFFT